MNYEDVHTSIAAESPLEPLEQTSLDDVSIDNVTLASAGDVKLLITVDVTLVLMWSYWMRWLRFCADRWASSVWFNMATIATLKFTFKP